MQHHGSPALIVHTAGIRCPRTPKQHNNKKSCTKKRLPQQGRLFALGPSYSGQTTGSAPKIIFILLFSLRVRRPGPPSSVEEQSPCPSQARPVVPHKIRLSWLFLSWLFLSVYSRPHRVCPPNLFPDQYTSPSGKNNNKTTVAMDVSAAGRYLELGTSASEHSILGHDQGTRLRSL